MTDSRVDVPVDRDTEPVAPDPAEQDAQAPGKGSPDSNRSAAVSGELPQAGPADPDPTAEVKADPEPDHPATAASDTASQADPTSDAEGDPDQLAPGVVHGGAAQIDLAGADNTVEVASATTRAGSALTDPAEGGRTDPGEEVLTDHAEGRQADQVHSVLAAAGPTTGEPPLTVAAAPSLRDPDEAALRVSEAAVFASPTPMTARALSQILPDDIDPAAVIAALQARYAGRGIELCDIGGGLQFRTAADLAPQLRKVVQVPRRLPRVALETLAIVAYHQPITRPEIEDLRGTGLSQQTLDVLLENDLIVARGRKETPGRPTLWGTTAKFLEYFGLRDIRELPRRQDLLLEAVRPEAEGETIAAAAEAAEPQRVEPPPA